MLYFFKKHGYFYVIYCVTVWNGTFLLKGTRGPTAMDYILEEVQEVTLPKVIKWISSTVMIFGGVAPFIPQYREIKRKNDAEGFSLYVCLVLLIANTLRILFWYVFHFFIGM